MTRTARGVLAALLFVLTIVAANVTLAAVGVVTLPPGVVAPAAVLFVGLALVVRDVVHEELGWRGVLHALAAGTAVSLALAPEWAVASACAFLLSELLDAVVYTRLRARGLLLAAAVSSVLGAALDSVVFLALSPLPGSLFGGQMYGKALGVAAGLAALAAARHLWQAKRTVERLTPS